MGVSIPHRYAKNAQPITGANGAKEFQFLIGTLKTLAIEKNRDGVSGFQFLIGTLKTPRRICDPT